MKVDRSAKGSTYLYIELSIEFPSFPDVFAAFPEIEFRSAENITGFRKYRFATLCQPANVVGMAMGKDDHIDVFWLVASGRQPLRGLSWRQPLAELFVFAWQCTIARVEQDELLSCIHDRRNVRMLKSLGVDIVRARQGMHVIYRGVGSVVGMQPITDGLRVQNRCDLEAAELEAIEGGLRFAL